MDYNNAWDTAVKQAWKSDDSRRMEIINMLNDLNTQQLDWLLSIMKESEINLMLSYRVCPLTEWRNIPHDKQLEIIEKFKGLQDMLDKEWTWQKIDEAL